MENLDTNSTGQSVLKTPNRKELTNSILELENGLVILNNKAINLISSSAEGEGDLNLESLGTINGTIENLKNQLRIKRAELKQNGWQDEEKLLISYDTQSILSSSSVTKKVPALLVDMPKK